MRNPTVAILEASRCAPLEACGITLGGTAIVLTNVSHRPATTFRVRPEELRKAIEAADGAPWDGVWHSHPDGLVFPSEDDLEWHPPGKRLYIVALERVYEYDQRGVLVATHDG
jgi:proteasome lid subunit RPN8/RPN11